MSISPLSYTRQERIGLARRELIASFPGHTVERDLTLGRVFLGDGTLLPDWTTYRARRTILLRGNTFPSPWGLRGWQLCPECGQVLYFGCELSYLSPSPPPDAEIFEPQVPGLVVTERLFGRINLKRWPKLRVKKLPVLEIPTDGLLDLPSDFRPNPPPLLEEEPPERE